MRLKLLGQGHDLENLLGQPVKAPITGNHKRVKFQYSINLMMVDLLMTLFYYTHAMQSINPLSISIFERIKKLSTRNSLQDRSDWLSSQLIASLSIAILISSS
jgi:hypothetical protein